MESHFRYNDNKAETAAKKDGALRCVCGNLLARLVPKGVELKCRRCKRQIILPLGTSQREREN